MFSRRGLERLFAAINPRHVTLDLEDVYLHRDRYIRIIDDVVAFAQGRDLGLAHRIARGDFLPEGPRFRSEPVGTYRGAVGKWGKGDLARHLVAFMFTDLVSLFNVTISPHFNLTNYGEKLTESLPAFDLLAAELARPPNLIEQMMLEVADERIAADVELVCLTCPFPGNLMGALVIGNWLAAHRPAACAAGLRRPAPRRLHREARAHGLATASAHPPERHAIRGSRARARRVVAPRREGRCARDD